MILFKRHSVLLVVAFCLMEMSCSEKSRIHDTSESIPSVAEEQNYSETSLSPGEYVQWFKGNHNHLQKSQNVNGVKYTLSYRTPEFLALMQQQNENITKSELDSAMQDFSDLVQFRLQIEVPGSGQEFLKYNLTSESDYESRVNYYAFEMQKDIFLKTEKGDSIPCSIYHFERSYGASPSSVFLIAFAGVNTNEKMEITVFDREIGKEKIRFVFDPKELKNIPQLKTL